MFAPVRRATSIVVTLVACTTGDPAAPEKSEPIGSDAGAAGPTAAPVPTWFRDVEPIVQVDCASCHSENGTGGFPLDQLTMTSLSTLASERVAARVMPPWPPGRGGAAIVGARALSDDAVDTIVRWAAAGAPPGDPRDHVERAPRTTPIPARPADLRVELAPGEVYQQPTSPFVTDEIRCFVLPLPTEREGMWIEAVRWRAGNAYGIHNLGGVVVDAQGAAAALARAGKDGRAGFECGAGVDRSLGAGANERERGTSVGANGTGGPGDGASILPAGTAVRVPAGGAVVMRVHYAVKHLKASDRSGVDLWLAPSVMRPRPLVLASVSAPVEVPCPTGVSLDPSHTCSRENAFARFSPADPTGARAQADARLASCGTTLQQATAATSTGAHDGGEHFLVPTSCASVLPFGGTIRTVEARLQTRGASVRVEAERADGSWSTVLDIPQWRWAWESAYVLEQGVSVEAGRRLRVLCTFDNGTANQWSALTGEPGHDQPARPPQLAPGYLVSAPHRGAEACTAYVGIERAPHRGAAWPTLCHEAQAVVDDVCGVGASSVDLVSRGCPAADIDASVAILGASAAAVRTASCP